MTSEEVLAVIASKTGLSNTQYVWVDKLDLAEHNYGTETVNYNNPMWYFFRKIEDKWSLSTEFQYCHKDTWESEGIQEMKIFFNPFAFPMGIMRWLTMEPKNSITQKLLYSQYNWRKMEFEDIGDLYKQIVAEPDKFFQMAYQKASYSRRNARPPMRRNTEWTSFDIDLTMTESGRADYWCDVHYNSVELSEAELDDIRTKYEEDGEEATLELIEEIVRERIYDSDGDYQNYNYDDHDSSDTQLDSDYTDYREILERIIE